ncbi:rRNA maturation RNase YbeY [Clostridium sp. 19966]|uniref:rRNA maturation RNase YbeY n=1 Tax=Clostridium sp. 19966 TaxID=2768166 RepID=UPI0028DDDBA4|nr:rRNA maturation RNase YbeY [Clostridium sp. 19966]MDT8715319.1 rRNA maturation RNase YbeY [Clostridium sp. 19966]
MLLIENEQDKIKWEKEYEDILNQVINLALKEERVNCKTQISVVLVDNDEIKELNKEHRKIDRVTDVLSFPMLDYEEGKVFKECYEGKDFDISYLDGEELVLGDIVLSLEKAEEQRKEFGHSFVREMSYLVVHSVLHLLGYDHMVEKDKERMRKREEEILSKYKISR